MLVSAGRRPRYTRNGRRGLRDEPDVILVVGLASVAVDADAELVERVRVGDESAFAELLRRYQPRLLRVAEATVMSRAVAEEVCQDTWLAVVRGVERFEGRSSFKTWLFSILLNRARSAVGKEQRAGLPIEDDGERFDRSGAWAVPPVPWADRVDEKLLAEQVVGRVRDLLPELPSAQRQVVTLRDVEGLGAEEVSALLGITDGNQRVLLHRGRARLRSLIGDEMGAVG